MVFLVFCLSVMCDHVVMGRETLVGQRCRRLRRELLSICVDRLLHRGRVARDCRH
jgi:hypothetical protein